MTILLLLFVQIYATFSFGNRIVICCLCVARRRTHIHTHHYNMHLFAFTIYYYCERQDGESRVGRIRGVGGVPESGSGIILPTQG